MDGIKNARARLLTYPKFIGACGPEAMAYAKCVTEHMGEVQKHACQTEFQSFKACVQKAAKKMGTKL